MRWYKRQIFSEIISFLIILVLRTISRSMTLTELHPERVQNFWESNKNVILSLWHGRLFMIPNIYRGKGIKILISRHGDGDVIARAIQGLGFGAIRGSTTRGGFSALRNLLKAANNGYDIAITPDGPRGPRQKLQGGIIQLARLSGAPILPISFGASRKKILKSWDSFLFPIPFSRGVFLWGEPIYVDNRKDAAYLEEKRLEVENKMNEITETVDNYFQN